MAKVAADHRAIARKIEQDRLKRMAAEFAVALVDDGMVVGLGSGTTATIALQVLAARIAKGLRIRGIPTSAAVGAVARRLNVPLTSFDEHDHIDITIDGADEVERGSLNLIKGKGGALLREKIVAQASRRMIVVVDESKLVDRLGRGAAVPVEVVPFGWQLVRDKLAKFCPAVVLRERNDSPFVTDGGNYVLDCNFGVIDDPQALERRLSLVTGVIESGLFLGLATRVVVGTKDGPRSLER